LVGLVGVHVRLVAEVLAAQAIDSAAVAIKRKPAVDRRDTFVVDMY